MEKVMQGTDLLVPFGLNEQRGLEAEVVADRRRERGKAVQVQV